MLTHIIQQSFQCRADYAISQLVIIGIPGAEDDTSVVSTAPDVVPIAYGPVTSGLNVSSERVAPRNEDEANGAGRIVVDWCEDNVRFAVRRTPKYWLGVTAVKHAKEEKQCQLSVPSPRHGKDGFTYVPATVLGAFWQNWLRSTNEVLVGMAKPVTARFARATTTDALKARMLPEVSEPTSLVVLTHKRYETTIKYGQDTIIFSKPQVLLSPRDTHNRSQAISINLFTPRV